MKTVEQMRQDMPVLSKYIFLNAGSLCPTPTPVMDSFFTAYQQWHERGAGLSKHYEEMRDAVTDQTRSKLAKLLNCDPLELALTSNATEGVNIVAWGLDWKPQDEVIITTGEHPANAVVWMYNQERLGIKLRFLPAYTSSEELIANLARLLNARTRLVSFSHVLSANGHILPVEQMTAMAHARGAMVLIDGAHAVGQMPVDLRDVNCDFYTLNGHKWIFGPAGTGALYVRQDRVSEVRPTFMGDVGYKTFDYREGGSYTPPPGARRYEYATRNWAAMPALSTAIDYVSDIGIENIRERVKTLTHNFKQGLVKLPLLANWSPMDPEESAGLVCFGFKGHNAKDIYAYLEAQGICPRFINDDLLRVSIGYFTLESELDTLLDALQTYLNTH